jgi:hypothetical protein
MVGTGLLSRDPDAYELNLARTLAAAYAEFALQLGRNGRRLVEQRYDYRQACQPMDAVYERAALESRA